ncbi:MAG: VOC family protein [Sciscionella sp.]
MEILGSRLLIRPTDFARSVAFYRDILGLAIYREFPGGTVFFAGQGTLEISGGSDVTPTAATELWLQVRDVSTAATELALAGIRILRGPKVEPWGLHEMWIADPDGLRIVLVEVPPDHPLRRDVRDA